MEVPSGSIYKHLFEAQSQLVDSLEKAKLKKNGPSSSRRGTVSRSSWAGLESNASLAGYESDEADYQDCDIDRVRSLDDEIAAGIASEEPHSVGFTITERLTEKRLAKHSTALATLDQKLAEIKAGTENALRETLATANRRLNEKVQLARALLAPLEQEANDKTLYQRTYESLQDQWLAVRDNFKELKADLKVLTQQIQGIEESRTRQLTGQLLSSRRELQRIAYLAEADVIRLIAELITETNKSLVSNRRHFSDVIARLSRHIVSEQLNSHVFYQKHLVIWKKQYIAWVVSRFTEYINSTEISAPPDQETAFVHLQDYYRKSWAEWRNQNFATIFENFAPPKSTRINAGKIIDQFESLRDELNAKNMDFLQESVKSFRESEQKRTAEIESLKDELQENQICDDEEVQDVVQLQLLVLSQEISGKHADSIQHMSIVMEDSSIRFKSQIDTVRRLMLALARIWDSHREKVENLDKIMRNEFNKQKDGFEHQRSVREQNLQNQVKKLSQQTTEEQLANTLGNIDGTIKVIKNHFKDYEKLQHEKLALFGPKYAKEATIYCKDISGFFERLEEFLVGPNMQESCNDEALQLFEAVKKIETKIIGENAELDSRMSSIRSSLNLTAEASSRPSTAMSRPGTGCRSAASRGSEQKRLYIDQLMHEAESSKPTRTQLLQPNLDPVTIPPYIRDIILLDDDVKSYIEQIREMFNKHTGKYPESARLQYSEQTTGYTERMQDEINLELQLYNQRPDEIRESIYSKRKSEVDDHRLRTQRHLRAINEKLDAMKFSFVDLEKLLLDRQSEYLEWVKGREPLFSQCTKSEKLMKLMDSVRSTMTSQKDMVTDKVESLKLSFQDDAHSIRGSNAFMLQTFKTFDEGGNFSVEEVATLTRRIEKANSKVASIKNKFDFEIDELKEKLIDSAMDSALRAEDKLKYHLIDVTFIEQLCRWKINTQVKLKAVANKCNSQASDLRVATDALRQLILPGVCGAGNDDVTSIKEQLGSVMKMLQKRTDLLSCRSDSGKSIEELASLKNSVQVGNAPPGQPGSVASGSPSHSVMNKQPIGLSTVNSGGSSPSSSRTKLNRQSRSQIGAELAPVGSEQFIRKTKHSVKSQRKKTGQARMCQPGYIQGDENQQNCTVPQQPLLFQHQVLTAIGVVTVRRRDVKFDIKYLLFGAFQPHPSDEPSFLEENHRVLWDALDGMLSTSESYYKTRGNRTITRPVDIRETFDKQAENNVVLLNSYDRQTRSFHKSSLDEFHKQLDVCEQLMQQLPDFFFRLLMARTSGVLEASIREIFETVFKRKWQELEGDRKYAIKARLRPDLGHPANRVKLDDLLGEEQSREEQVMTLIHEAHRQTMFILGQHQTDFFDRLAETSTWFLHAFDNIIVQADCHTSDVYPIEQPRNDDPSSSFADMKALPGTASRLECKDTPESSDNVGALKSVDSTNQMIVNKTQSSTRRMTVNHGRASVMRRGTITSLGSGLAGRRAALRSQAANDTSPNRKTSLRSQFAKKKLISHPGIRYAPPKNTPFEPYASPLVQTKKQTTCHTIVLRTRDKFMLEIQSKISKMANQADKNKNERIALVEQWSKEWHKDVVQVRNLY